MATAASSTSSGATIVEDASLSLVVRNEFAEVLNGPKGTKSDVVVMATISSIAIETEGAETTAARNPLELVVVLDRSGSMAGNKLALCLSTMEFLIDELSGKDELGLVVFDTNVSEVFGLTNMDEDGKARALEGLKTIRAGSSTNLSGGLFKGVEALVESSKKKAAIRAEIPSTRAIMLLTDGMTNAGITDRNQLIALTKKMMGGIVGGGGASVHCFGYGIDADVEFCTAISEACGGMFYAVNEIDQVSTAFGNCLGGLLSVSAQNVKLTFTPATPDIVVKEVLTKFENTRDAKTGAIVVTIPDMYSEESRDIPFRLTIGPSDTELMSLGKFTVSFLDVKFEKLNHLEEDVSILRPKKFSSPEASKQNEAVGKQLIRLEAAKAIADAKKMADSGDLGGAKKSMSYLMASMEKRGVKKGDAGMLGGIMNDLLESTEMMSSTDEYKNRGRSKMAAASESHFAQRSNAVNSEEADSSTYQTSSRSKKMAKASHFSPPSSASKPASATKPAVAVAAPSVANNATTNSGLFKRLSGIFSSDSGKN